jgi:hypothetical protein
VTWLTWRQFRAQAITAAAALAAFAVLLGITGPRLAHLYAISGIGSCHGSCQSAADQFLAQLDGGTYWVVYLLSVVVILVIPVVIGIFWGAPLIAREYETGTFHLAWTQSVSSTRWLAVKLALTGLAAVAVTEGLSLMQAWWAAPIGRAAGLDSSGSTRIGMGKYSTLVFATHGITPVGYAAFAFALGAAAGLLIRRAVPAMAVTLAIFAVLQLAMPLWIRPHLFSPDHATITIMSTRDITFETGSQGAFAITTGGLASQPGAWVISSGAVNAAGHPVGTSPAACLPAVVTGNGNSGLNCLASHGIRIAVTYQPASRYWAFQWTETAIFLALALALAGCCFWRLQRRRS